MRWGWVSREQYEDLKEELASARTANKWLRDTLDRVHERALSAPPSVAAVAPPPTPAVPREPSVVAAAVREQAQGDSRLAAHFWSYAAQLRRENLTDEQIAEALSQWETSEPMEPVPA